jgi:C1A family cysteine protease
VIHPSALFVDSSARRISHTAAGANLALRTVLKAIVRCGIPPEEHWPYDEPHLQREPDAFAYSFQRGYRTIRYVRLDGPTLTGEIALNRVRWFLAAGFSIVLGFPVCSSLTADADIPFPTAADAVLGGHALTAVGFDDRRRIRSDKGALLVRNSWGTAWGDQGYGWLPYSYVQQRLATDLWTLLRRSWIRSGEFELPSERP